MQRGKIMNKHVGVLLTIAVAVIFLTALSANAVSYTLQIFGNANMDDTIDEQDIEYVQGIIDGSKDKTDLADANHDGTIDKEDITQIELIIDGTEKKLTIVDNNGRIVTINTPANRVVCFYRDSEPLVAIGAKDKIIGLDSIFMNRYMPEISEGAGLMDAPNVGSQSEPNYEKILELMPDVVSSPSAFTSPARAAEMAAHLPHEIPVAGIDFYSTTGDQRFQNIEMLGYLVGKEEKARELVDWIQGYESTLVERTKDLASDEKPTVLCFMGPSNKVQSTAHGSGLIESLGGGRNLAYGVVPSNASSVEVSNEWIVEQNPDVIFVSSELGWNTTTEEAESMFKEFIDKPGWDKMSAVVNGKVYLIDYTTMINRYIIGGCYIAKCLHPELFEDIDPENVNKEYFEKFLGFDHKGVWIYPAPPSN